MLQLNDEVVTIVMSLSEVHPVQNQMPLLPLDLESLTRKQEREDSGKMPVKGGEGEKSGYLHGNKSLDGTVDGGAMAPPTPVELTVDG